VPTAHASNRETTTISLDHCPACDGTDLYQVRLCRPVYLNKVIRTAIQFFSVFKTVPVTSSVCLTCGVVTPHVEESDIETIRRWKKADEMTKPRNKTTEPEL